MSTAVKERPILFSAPMVRAILAGDKTQTRRMMKFLYQEIVKRDDGAIWPWSEHPHKPDDFWHPCPYGQVGDRLWVRETFVQGFEYDAVTDRLRQFDDDGNELPKTTWYRATDSISWSDDAGWETNVPWKPSIHMPRSACRIKLEITGVRVERLWDISDFDAEDEGTRIWAAEAQKNGNKFSSIRSAWQAMWESINGSDSWQANPWVWVVEFRRIA